MDTKYLQSDQQKGADPPALSQPTHVVWLAIPFYIPGLQRRDKQLEIADGNANEKYRRGFPTPFYIQVPENNLMLKIIIACCVWFLVNPLSFMTHRL